MDINKMMTNGIFTMNDKHTQSILIYQGVHCCTKVCNLQLDASPSKSRDNRMHSITM